MPANGALRPSSLCGCSRCCAPVGALRRFARLALRAPPKAFEVADEERTNLELLWLHAVPVLQRLINQKILDGVFRAFEFPASDLNFRQHTLRWASSPLCQQRVLPNAR